MHYIKDEIFLEYFLFLKNLLTMRKMTSKQQVKMSYFEVFHFTRKTEEQQKKKKKLQEAYKESFNSFTTFKLLTSKFTRKCEKQNFSFRNAN